ncbi:RsmB/NOP family class I SAM-dependent RNA methyltransferase [Collinsella sp. An307]|uniref:RsmB/NOP family class I SAM-dependent RNA methyltransferase n=1 Tax=Collinsella sp. An307 TaxID=1965630 RepID=UPI000B387F96|nr:RsmB/NOP family class I SAM-dependent RNA methyltransferase [Collinsella sp. An307]OUO22439.1 Fmu (Sun) domain-containing protein [Collinsella sp. An307]
MSESGLPAFLAQEIEKRYPADTCERIFRGFAEARERPVTLRANTLRAAREEVASELDAADIAHEGVAWYSDAFILGDTRKRAVWDLPLYREGKVYLQSLSSMIPPLALAPRDGADVLDMCAAPGGKTAEMAALAPGAHLTACEMSAPRAEKLTFNLNKLGVTAVNVMRTDARRLDEFFSFDQILLDAPCTGSGTVRAGDAKAAVRITEKLLAKVTRSQRSLLDRALTVLKPGGVLVYSTCSILPQENEEQVMAALKRHRDCEVMPLTGALAEDAPARPATAQAIADAAERCELPLLANGLAGTLTICPTRLYEGFYIAVIRKKAR